MIKLRDVVYTVDFVTATSLTLSIVALAIILLVFFRMRQNIRKLRLLEKGLEAVSIVQEFTQRSKRLEQEIIDQKVRLEVIELRFPRNAGTLQPVRREIGRPLGRDLNARPAPKSIMPVSEVQEQELQEQELQKPPLARKVLSPDRDFGKTEIEALRLVSEADSQITVKEIQNKIQRTREHTARLMNSLFHQGCVERDSNLRPFTYSITQKGRERLGRES